MFFSLFSNEKYAIIPKHDEENNYIFYLLFKEDATVEDMLKGITHSFLLRKKITYTNYKNNIDRENGRLNNKKRLDKDYSYYDINIIKETIEEDQHQSNLFIKVLLEKNLWYISSGLLEEKIARISY